MITQTQIDAFDRDGAVTIDTPIDHRRLDAAAAVVSRLDEQNLLATNPNDFRTEPELLDIVQDPFFEEAAKRVLRAPDVEYYMLAVRRKRPTPGQTFGPTYEHTDINWTLEELDAVPRRIAMVFLLWLADVNEDTGPYLYRPGTHRQIARAIHGQPFPPGKHMIGNGIPKGLDYPPLVPVIAKKGQATAATTACIHSASVNTGTKPRLVMFLSWVPRGLVIGFDEKQERERLEWHRELYKLFRPERRHVLAKEVAGAAV